MDQCEVLQECVIKVENVKQEPDDQGEEETCNFTEGDVSFACKSEVKEDEEEEIKPPVRLFLKPEEVPEEQQEHEVENTHTATRKPEWKEMSGARSAEKVT